MSKLTLLLIPLIFLSSCTIDWNDEKDSKIAELEKQIQDDIFNNKQECSRYTENLKIEAEKETNDMTNSLKSVYFKSLKEVFYSKNKQTCFAIYELGIGRGDNGGSLVTKENFFKEQRAIILDILSNKTELYSLPEKENEFNFRITELKGE